MTNPSGEMNPVLSCYSHARDGALGLAIRSPPVLPPDQPSAASDRAAAANSGPNARGAWRPGADSRSDGPATCNNGLPW